MYAAKMRGTPDEAAEARFVDRTALEPSERPPEKTTGANTKRHNAHIAIFRMILMYPVFDFFPGNRN
jgi:hypothetical protein